LLVSVYCCGLRMPFVTGNNYYWGHAVVHLVKALRYKSEGRGFDSRRCHWNFPLKQSFRPHYGPGVDSASNRNEYQEHFLACKGGRCVGLQPYHLQMSIVLKSGSLNIHWHVELLHYNQRSLLHVSATYCDHLQGGFPSTPPCIISVASYMFRSPIAAIFREVFLQHLPV